MTHSQLATLINAGAALYMPGLGSEGMPLVAAGFVKTGGLWILAAGDAFHLLRIEGKKETTRGGMTTWSHADGTPMVTLAPLELCDELNRADNLQEIAEGRAYYAKPEAALWLKESIANAEWTAEKDPAPEEKPAAPEPDKASEL